ncbi:MAG: hypothetical protein HC855_14510 [Rhizobiales bacterium]|nr:hypothetical protein [Hyphomicrobiales bacterium]
MRDKFIRVLTLFAVAALAGCSDVPQPFGKQNAEVSPGGWITRPPEEAFQAAGPGAQYELDYETLEGPLEKPGPVEVSEFGPAQTAPAAPAAEPEPVETPEPAPPPSKPKKEGAVEIKAVAVVPVKGAKGTGNDDLTKAMRETLQKAGWPVLKSPRKDALTVAGVVSTAAGEPGKEKVTVTWKVAAPDGRSLGSIKQANSVAVGSLDKGFGENAAYVTEAAATGIFDLVKKLR